MKVLTGYKKQLYRIRVGKYRIIFEDDKDRGVVIYLIGKRGDVYKMLKTMFK